MSPILVRPVREQLEHDRVIRLLQAKYKRKFEVAINPGNEQNAPVGAGPSPWFPDLVLQSDERSRKLLGTVEVETTESVNHLEAMSQWVTFSRLKSPFHLYVPTGCIDSTRRLCTDLNVNVAELWAYQAVGEQIRFTLVQRSAAAEKARASEPAEKPKPVPKPTVAAKPPAAAKPAGRNGAAASPPAARPGSARSARTATPPASGRRPAPAKTTKPAPAASPSGRTRRNAGDTAPTSRRPAAAKTAARKATPRAAKRR